MEAYGALAECAVVCASVVVAAIVDAKTRTIPDACSLVIVFSHVVACVVLACAGADAAELAGAAVFGALSVGLPLVLAALLSDGVGGGDVKLFSALGFALGWLRALAILFLACVLTVLAGLAVYITQRYSEIQSRLLATTVPMAPQIALATLVSFCLFPL